MPGRTVRDATFDLFRRRGLTTMFANPGSTEVPFLTGLPDDLEFVLAPARGLGGRDGDAGTRSAAASRRSSCCTRPPGSATRVSALATARVNRAPLVVLVGQQDRRHLAYEPFLAGRLAGLAGDYPVRVEQPVRAQDVPAAIERAYHAAATARGPALVIVPMDDWEAARRRGARARRRGRRGRARAARRTGGRRRARRVPRRGARRPRSSSAPARTTPATWAALVELAERLAAPVFQEAFGARAGFPQDHRAVPGRAPGRTGPGCASGSPRTTRCSSSARPAFRQSVYAPGRLTEPGTRIAVVTEDPEEAHRSPAELAVLAPPASVCAALARASPPDRRLAGRTARSLRPPPEPPAGRRAADARATCSPRSPSACRATRSCSRRRPSTGRSSTSGCPPASRSAT